MQVTIFRSNQSKDSLRVDFLKHFITSPSYLSRNLTLCKKKNTEKIILLPPKKGCRVLFFTNSQTALEELQSSSLSFLSTNTTDCSNTTYSSCDQPTLLPPHVRPPFIIPVTRLDQLPLLCKSRPLKKPTAAGLPFKKAFDYSAEEMWRLNLCLGILYLHKVFLTKPTLYKQ